MAQGWTVVDGFERQAGRARWQASRASKGGRLIVDPTMEASMDASRAQIADAYRVCREIARKQARNFYYSFVALPEAKRDAICAVYAFMRHADDLSDDESISVVERQTRLDQWLEAWHEASQGGVAADPVFLALRDAQNRFEIPSQLLEQLVEGTTMDLRRVETVANRDPASYDTYESFDELYRYCYLVASVVGLVCIRIFGYHDSRAEKLAEETGIAFQLTNILRDVREDSERGRIYLPLEDLRRFGVTPEQLTGVHDERGLTEPVRELLRWEERRAEAYYHSGKKLLPLIDADSRPALWVLITIYRRLLLKIKGKGYNVFSARVSVPTYEKLAILGWGTLRTLGGRG
jgi:phytoene synthase